MVQIMKPLTVQFSPPSSNFLHPPPIFSLLGSNTPLNAQIFCVLTTSQKPLYNIFFFFFLNHNVRSLLKRNRHLSLLWAKLIQINL